MVCISTILLTPCCLCVSCSGNPCKASPCSLCWPTLPLAKCGGSPNGTFKNITLRNIFIHKPLGSPGVILADDSNPIINLTFDNVIVSRSIPSDLDTRFYALDQPITDKYVNGILISFYKIAITCALLLPVYFLGRGLYNLLETGAQKSSMKMTGTDEKNAPILSDGNIDVLTDHKVILGIAIAVTLAISIQLQAITANRTYNSREYFSCRGVVNSNVTGSTWPVPTCFVDETDQ